MSGRKASISIALLMTIICFIAIDIALVRASYGGKVLGRSSGYLAIVLPMANLLLISLPKLTRDHSRRWFWFGFEVVGWVVIAILGHMDQYAKQILFIPYYYIHSLELYDFLSAPDLALIYTIFVLFYTPPQLLLAWMGGRISAWLARHLVLIGRRPAPGESR